MPYIGVAPSSGLFRKLDSITVVNGQAAYTMQHNSSNFKPGTASQLIVSVNGVIQAPEDAFTIDGSTITFTENLVTGDVIDFIVALGDVGNAVTPVDGSVTTAKLANDAVTSAKLATNISIDGNLGVGTSSPQEKLHVNDSSSPAIRLTNSTTGTGSGDGAELTIPDADNGLRIINHEAGIIRFDTNGAEAMRIDSGGRIKMAKQPRFCVRSGPAQTATGPAKVQFTNVEVNVGSCWSTTNHRFTAPIAGDYYFFFTIMNNSAQYMRTQLYKNGSAFGEQFFNENQTYARTSAAQMFTLAANDYVELYYDINGEGYGDVHSSYRSFVGYLVG